MQIKALLPLHAARDSAEILALAKPHGREIPMGWPLGRTSLLRKFFEANHSAVFKVYILFLVSDRSRRADIRGAHVQRAYRTCLVASKAFGFHETKARGKLHLE